MLESYEDLASGLGILSNHFRKYLKIVQTGGPILRQRLDEKGMTGKVHLWRKSHNYKKQMELVASVAKDPGEVRKFLGTYFALQVLQLHFLNIDWLRRESSNYKDRLKVYRHILTRLRFQMKNLISSYISELVQLLSGSESMEGIVLCNVGMIMDQDDLDVGVFIDENVDREFWNQVASQLGAEFLKYGNKMHFYLAELAAESTYLTTINDFNDYLDKSIHNFILISELLLAERLCGDSDLISQLETEIVDHFYYDKGNIRLHEGFLRGLMGEVQDLVRYDMSSRWISPKNHGLRLIHSTMAMLKTIHGIHEHGSRDIIDILQIKDPQHSELYAGMQDIFNFIEMFFYVYQLMVSTDDNFNFDDDVSMDNLDNVAIVMGYPGLGPVRPAMRLITHYYEEMDRLKEFGQKIIENVNAHLKRITVFNQIIKGEPPEDYQTKWSDNLALNILKLFKIYRGMIYWDDILQLLSENEGAMLIRMMESLEELDPQERMYVFNRLLRLLSFDMDSMVTTAVLFSKHTGEYNIQFYLDNLQDWLMQLIEKNPGRMGAIINLITTHPSVLTEFLLVLKPDHLIQMRRLTHTLGRTVRVEDALKKKFLSICEVLAFSSNNYRRVFSRVVQVKPEIVNHINSDSILDNVADQLWAELSDAADPADLKTRLAIYYDYSFCRCGLLATKNLGDLRLFYDTYNSFFRRYFRWLYRASQWEVESKLTDVNYRVMDDDDQPFAILCSGGYAREEAFENDIDMFILCKSNDPDFLHYGAKIVNEINRELSRRGVMPHHRFAELLNSYVIPISDLEAFMSEPRETDFIEWSQILTSRILVGSQSFNQILSDILSRHVFNDPSRFIQGLLSELNSRQVMKQPRRDGIINVKEDPGGLRDIQTIVCACQARVGQRELVIWRALQSLGDAIPRLDQEFKILSRAYKFMRTFHDIYYLSLSEGDEMLRDRLLSTAHRMGLLPGEIEQFEGTAPRLVNSYNYYRGIARQAIEKIAEEIT